MLNRSTGAKYCICGFFEASSEKFEIWGKKFYFHKFDIQIAPVILKPNQGPITYMLGSVARSFWAAKSDFCSIMQKFLHDQRKIFAA